MGRTLTFEELDKAARNLEKIESYLVPRTAWAVPPAGRTAIESLRRSATRLAARTRAWATSRDSDPLEPESPPPPDDLPPGTLDADQLTGFASFLERLDRWFESSAAEPPPGADAEPPARRLHTSLEAVRDAITKIAAERAPESAADTEQQPQQDAEPAAVVAGRRAGPAAAVDDVFAGAPKRDVEAAPAPARQIAFTSAEPEPMFRWVDAENIELTDLARERIEELFANQGVTYFRYQLENFAEEVKRRARNAPEGQVLVVKVRDIGGERRPFLSYVAESTLRDP